MNTLFIKKVLSFWGGAIAVLFVVSLIFFFNCAKEKHGEWISLFNGKDLSGWQVPEKGVWKVENGEIVTSWDNENPGGSWIFIEKEYEDFEIRLKFMINKGGNSGVCIRVPSDDKTKPADSGYEIQIDFNNDKNPTGSIYDIAPAYSIIGAYTPQETVAGKEEEWNDYEISAVGEHIVVKVNGYKVAECFDRKSLKGLIGLQLHDEKSVARFKDIQIKTLPAKRPLGATLEERLTNAPGEFKKLFNGKNLDGWQVLWGGEWKVVDGVIEGGIEDGMGWLLTEEEFSDFIYRLKVKITKGGNSGLTIRFPVPADPNERTWDAASKNDKLNPAFGGYELQIYNSNQPGVGNPSGSIYNIGRAYGGKLKPDEWNEYVVYAEGPHMAVYINGEKVAEAKDTRSLNGVVGLQVHVIMSELVGVKHEAYSIWFKDIDIKAVK